MSRLIFVLLALLVGFIAVDRSQAQSEHPACIPHRNLWNGVRGASDLGAMDRVIANIPRICPALDQQARRERTATATRIAGGAKGTKTAPIVTNRPASPSVDAESIYWQSARTCSDWRSYLAQYPTGRYASLARNRLSEAPCVQPVVADRPPLTPSQPRAGQEFDDCNGAGWCPRMVTIPSGSFTMGSSDGENGRSAHEGPAHQVSVRAFSAGKFEVTFDQWAACVNDGSCSGYAPADKGYGRGNRPVINVSWEDSIRYVQWLTNKTGKTYRLLTEAEWEYAARAGTSSAYPWGDVAEHAYANYGADACCTGLASGRDQWVNTSPVGTFPANRFGLFDMHGNVWEWVEDCWHDSYSGAPSDGSAWTSGACSSRVFRGGSWDGTPRYLRSAFRSGFTPSLRNRNLGFRVARTVSNP